MDYPAGKVELASESGLAGFKKLLLDDKTVTSLHTAISCHASLSDDAADICAVRDLGTHVEKLRGLFLDRGDELWESFCAEVQEFIKSQEASNSPMTISSDISCLAKQSGEFLRLLKAGVLGRCEKPLTVNCFDFRLGLSDLIYQIYHACVCCPNIQVKDWENLATSGLIDRLLDVMKDIGSCSSLVQEAETNLTVDSFVTAAFALVRANSSPHFRAAKSGSGSTFFE